MRPTRLFFSVLLFLIFLRTYAQPGKDGALTVSASTQIVNQYSPVSASIAVGNTTLSIASTSIISLCPGDLIMVYQAQGAAIDFTNSAGYGNITAYNSAGLYEFKYVQSVNGNVITTQTTFTNAYSLLGHPQIIWVPQFTTLTVNSGCSIVPKSWKDTVITGVSYRFGGLVVIHAANIVNNGLISANGSGFRGGATPSNSLSSAGTTLYVSGLIADGGEKGEGIFGYQTDYDINGGRYGRGAPGNGGGGGTAHNAGGGGGANAFNGNVWNGAGEMVVNGTNLLSAWSLDPDYILNGNSLTTSSGGGRGGYTYAAANANANADAPGAAAWSGDLRRNMGGRGGRPLTNINPDTRIYFGGGGGAGSYNQNTTPPGGNGGGIVYLIATTGFSGSGLSSAFGDFAANTFGCSCDGASGGGAGGSVVIKTGTFPITQSAFAGGASGGNQLVLMPPGLPLTESEGPGGGGGGGLVAISNGLFMPNISISGSVGGQSLSGAVTEMTSNGATRGAPGQTATVTSTIVSYISNTIITSNSPICSGATISFTNQSATSYTWTGPNGFSSFVQNPTIPNASTLMDGTYTLSTTNTANCIPFLTQTIAVVVNPSPTLSVSNSTVCPGSSGTLIASGATTYTWNPGGLTGNSLTINPAATTVYTVTGASAAGCLATATKTVFVPTTMSVNINASPSTSACVGRTITLTASTSGGNPAYSYTWTGGPFTSFYNVTQPAGSYVYTVTGKDANNCLSVKTTSLNFVALPVISVSSQSICPGTASTLTPSGASTYTWRPGNFVVNPFVTSPAVTSNYTVLGAAQGCTSSATATVFVKPIPSLSFVTAAITCASLGSATVSASGGQGPFSYSWSPTAQTNSIAINLNPGVYTLSVFDAGTGCTSVSSTTFTSLVPFTGTLASTASMSCYGQSTGTAAIALSGGSSAESYSWTDLSGIQTTSVATALSAGLHTVVVTDNLTFCTVTQTFFINQPTAVTATVFSGVTNTCVGLGIPLSSFASGGTPPYSYAWVNGPGSLFYTPSESGPGYYLYTVNVLDANLCAGLATVGLTFNAYPPLTVNSATVCQGSPAVLTAGGAAFYSWLPGGFTASSITVSPSSSITYSLYGSTLGCTSFTSTGIVVNPVPVPVIITGSSVCQGSDINLSSLGSGSYLWSGPGGFSSVNQNTLVAAASMSNAGSYSLTLTDNNGCSASTASFIAVLPTPTAVALGATVCSGEPAILTASGGQTYLWNGPGSYTSSGAIAFIPVVNNNTAGSYTVFVYGNNICSSSAVVQVFGNNLPLPSPSITATSKACLNTRISMSGAGGGSYLWNGPAGFISHEQNLNFIISSVNASGIYTLSVKNADNCSASTTVQIGVYALPLATLTSSYNDLCVPLCTKLSLAPGNNVAPIVKSRFLISNLASADSTLSYCLQQPGDHLASVFFTDTNGCVNSATLNLHVFPEPTAGFEFTPQLPVENIDQVVFVNTSTGEKLNKFNWYFTENGGASSKEKHPVQVYEKAGTFPIAMTVTNAWGCTDTIVKVIVVEEDFNVFVPNAFSPNGDGRNDIFVPKGTGVAAYHLQVFDRWGERVFSSDDFLKGWDGSFKGSLCKPDTYTWKMDISSTQGKTKNLAGHVSIIQ